MNEGQERRRRIILGSAENQIRDNDPPETRQTLRRLIKEGFAREVAVELIGRVVVHELYNVLKQDENFDRKCFVAALRQLSKLPYDKDDESSYVATDINLPDVRQKLENPAGEIVGIEIKPSSTVKNGDFKGFKYLSELLGDRFLRGIVLYTGDQPVPFGSNLYALPVSTLWQTSEVPHEMSKDKT